MALLLFAFNGVRQKKSKPGATSYNIENK